MNNLQEVVKFLRLYVFGLVCIILAIVLIFLGHELETILPWYITEIIKQSISALLVTGLWQVAHHAYLEKFNHVTINNIVAEALARSTVELNFAHTRTNLTKEAEIIGLDDILPPSLAYTKNLIENSNEFSVILGSGNRWISKFDQALKSRLANAQRKTKFFFVHPESEAIIQIAARLEISKEEYILKINTAIRDLKTWANNSEGLEIYGRNFPTGYFLCVGDNFGIFSPKFVKYDNGKSPLFKLSSRIGGSFLEKLTADLDEVKKKSTRIWPVI